jgi:predicted nucleic acid-binding protein
MKIVVTDANIFFDLIGIGALALFFQLDHEVHTTGLVMFECDPQDLDELQPFLGSGRLRVRSFTVEELKEVETTGRRKGLRPADRSVLFHALELKGMVVSGDSDMRKECDEMKLECHGILWCIAELHRNGHYDAKECLALLDALEGINKWLPKDEMEKMRKELGAA